LHPAEREPAKKLLIDSNGASSFKWCVITQLTSREPTTLCVLGLPVGGLRHADMLLKAMVQAAPQPPMGLDASNGGFSRLEGCVLKRTYWDR